jgi:hypothetical protein
MRESRSRVNDYSPDLKFTLRERRLLEDARR